MATFRKRGDLQWEARVRRKGYPVASKTFETRESAEKWARAIEREMDKGAFIAISKESERTTLREALDRFIAEEIHRYSDVYRETRRAKVLQERSIAKRFLASIRREDVVDYVKERVAEGAKGNTVKLDLCILSSVYNAAILKWRMGSLTNPVYKIPAPKPGKRNRRLEAGEEERLLAACSPRYRSVFVFAIETAMRRSEIASLDWKNVNLARGTVYLPKTKNGEERTVPLTPTARRLLEEMEGSREGSVFGVDNLAITRAMIRATTKAQIKNLVFHDLRHEAISRFFEDYKLDAMEVKEISGHKTMQMLARYSHLRAERLVDKLAGARRGTQG